MTQIQEIRVEAERLSLYFICEVKEEHGTLQSFPTLMMWYEAQCYMRHDLTSKEPVFILQTPAVVHHQFNQDFSYVLCGPDSGRSPLNEFMASLWVHVGQLPKLPIPIVKLEDVKKIKRE